MKIRGRLVCLDKQEPRDEIYVRIDGVRVTPVWKRLKEGRSRVFESDVDENFVIEVWEYDKHNPDDLIGRHSINAGYLIDRGEQSVTFSGRHAKYRLFFYIDS